MVGPTPHTPLYEKGETKMDSNTTGDLTTSGYIQEPCKGCQGSGVQTRTDNGLTVVCPICGGTGTWSPQYKGVVYMMDGESPDVA